MGVVVTPSELNVNPVFLCGGAVHNIPIKKKKTQENMITAFSIWLYLRALLVKFIFMLPLDILELNMSIMLSHIL